MRRIAGREWILWILVIGSLAAASVAGLNGHWLDMWNRVATAGLAAGWALACSEARTWKQVAEDYKVTIRSMR